MYLKRTLVAVFLVTACACGGVVDDVRDDGSAGSDTAGSGGSRSEPEGSDPAEIPGTGGTATPDSGDPTSPDSGEPTDPAEPWQATMPPAACGLPEQGVAQTLTEDVFLDALVGRWLLCGMPSVFGTSDEVGLEIANDGSWYKLYVAADGAITRGQGFDRTGQWVVYDTSEMNGPGSFQLNLEVNGGGTIITHPAFASEPRKMRLDNEGVYQGNYAIDP